MIRGGVLPRWSGWLAVAAVVVSLAATLCVFVPDGAVSIRGSVVAWSPGFVTAVWYLGAAVALIQMGRSHPASA